MSEWIMHNALMHISLWEVQKCYNTNGIVPCTTEVSYILHIAYMFSAGSFQNMKRWNRINIHLGLVTTCMAYKATCPQWFYRLRDKI